MDDDMVQDVKHLIEGSTGRQFTSQGKVTDEDAVSI
jgi:hypothetical protein